MAGFKGKRSRLNSAGGFTACLVIVLLFAAFFIGGLLGGMVGGGLMFWAINPGPVAQGAAAASPTALLTATPTRRPSTPTPVRPTPSPTRSFAEAVDAVIPAVVTIVNERPASAFFFGSVRDNRIKGSGIVVDRRGYILTNYHVIEDAETLSVILADGSQISAELVAADRAEDLALLKIQQSGLAVVRWGDSGDVRPGQMVMAIGSALGDFPSSVTLGVVSGLDRALDLEDFVVDHLIQTDAAINRGNSGGPLVNHYGEVIGINTFIIRESRGQGIAEGIGFAIPADIARRLVDEWIRQDLGLPPDQ
ncbi:MAG: S1C family serine protease [Anaerolineae bacterium]